MLVHHWFIAKFFWNNAILVQQLFHTQFVQEQFNVITSCCELGMLKVINCIINWIIVEQWFNEWWFIWFINDPWRCLAWCIPGMSIQSWWIHSCLGACRGTVRFNQCCWDLSESSWDPSLTAGDLKHLKLGIYLIIVTIFNGKYVKSHDSTMINKWNIQFICQFQLLCAWFAINSCVFLSYWINDETMLPDLVFRQQGDTGSSIVRCFIDLQQDRET